MSSPKAPEHLTFSANHWSVSHLYMLYAGNRTSTTWVLVFTLNVYDWMVAVDVFMEVSGRFPAVRDNNAGYFTPNQSGLCAQTWLDHTQSVELKETSSCYIKIVKCPTCLCLQDLLCQHILTLELNHDWLRMTFLWLHRVCDCSNKMVTCWNPSPKNASMNRSTDFIWGVIKMMNVSSYLWLLLPCCWVVYVKEN